MPLRAQIRLHMSEEAIDSLIEFRNVPSRQAPIFSLERARVRRQPQDSSLIFQTDRSIFTFLLQNRPSSHSTPILFLHDFREHTIQSPIASHLHHRSHNDRAPARSLGFKDISTTCSRNLRYEESSTKTLRPPGSRFSTSPVLPASLFVSRQRYYNPGRGRDRRTVSPQATSASFCMIILVYRRAAFFFTACTFFDFSSLIYSRV